MINTDKSWVTGPNGIDIVELYGDGSDGDVTISANTTLAGDKKYNNLTVDARLNTGSYAVHVKNTLTINSGKLLRRDGAAGNYGAPSPITGVGASGGASIAGNTFGGAGTGAGGGGGNGGAAGVGAAGSAGTSTTGAGGNGGAGEAGATSTDFAGGAGGAGGTATPKYWTAYLTYFFSGIDLTLQGGAGGGGGGGGGGGLLGSIGGGGAGGGSGGGCVGVFARIISLTGSITALGGVGGKAALPSIIVGDDAGPGGGAGGGGGGLIVIICDQFSGSGTVSAAGGAASGGATNGSDGTVVKYNRLTGLRF